MNKVISCAFTLFIIVLSVKGQTVTMAKQMGGSSDDAGYSIATDASGNLYTTGFFNTTADFDPGSGIYNLISNGLEDVFISKLDANGTFQWAKQIGGAANDIARSLAIDAAGNILLTGYFTGITDFDPGPQTFNLTSAGGWDIFICKLDASGNFLWAKRIGGVNAEDLGYSIAVDAAGYVYTTGTFKGTIDFDPGAGVNNLTAAYIDVFVSKLDASGNFIWARNMGGNGADESYSIAVDASGNVYTTGYFKGYADFDPGPGVFNLVYNSSDADVFISKLDASGNFVWAKQFTSSPFQECYGHAIAVDASGNVYITGRFDSNTDFDTGTGFFYLNTGGSFDGFLSKLDPSGNLLWAKVLGGCRGLDRGNAIAFDAVGNVYTTGLFDWVADFDPGQGTFNLTPAGGTDAFVCKFSTSGVFIWAKHMGSTSNDYGYGLAIDGQGNIYSAGQFNGTANFNPLGTALNLTSFGGSDIYVHKISQTVTGITENSFGSSFRIYPNPTKGQLQIDLGKVYRRISVSIKNSVGQNLSMKNYISSQFLQLEISGNAGVYFTEIHADNLPPANIQVVKY